MNNYTRYYDRDNSQNSHSARQNCIFNHHPPFDASVSSEPPEKEETHKDERNRRVISREALFEDPDLFYQQEETGQTQQRSQDGAGVPWTQEGWLRAGEGTQDAAPSTSLQKANKLQKSLNVALSQPVQMSKAASMMQKMGWQGGALGRGGGGIVEPIAPNAAYATRTRGFGQAVAKPAPAPKQQNPKYQGYNMEHFNTNTLLHILEFVRNDKETEVLFAPQLFKNERKAIHGLVNDVINNKDMIDMTFDNVAQIDIVEDIHKYNRNVLCTQSEGAQPNRMLCLYKEAPDHVYLITPSDLSDDPPPNDIIDETANDDGHTSEGESKPKAKMRKRHGSEVKNDLKPEESKTEAKTDKTDSEEEENPFLRSITRNLKKTKESDEEATSEDKAVASEGSIDAKKKDAIDKIIKYFVEFVDQEEYTEFRFLGEFQPEEIDSINSFLTNVFNCISTRQCDDGKYESVLKRVASREQSVFEMREDCNGGPVIFKYRKEDPK